MGIPDWFLTVDSRKTKSLHSDACVQLLLHFKGPLANRLEQDFSRLLASGRLDAPTLYIPGFINTKRKVKISYKQCSVQDPNEKKSKNLFISELELFLLFQVKKGQDFSLEVLEAVQLNLLTV